MREVECVQCGKKFLARSWNTVICSEECRHARALEQRKEIRAQVREGALDNRRKNIHKQKSTMQDLTKAAIEAKERGMSYGKYMARRRTEDR